jgi:hypothetical protein
MAKKVPANRKNVQSQTSGNSQHTTSSSASFDPREWEKAVRKAHAAWSKGRETKDDFKLDVPDGVYVATIVDAGCGVAKTGDPWMRIAFTIEEPEEHSGKQGSLFLSARNEDAASIAARALQRLGYETKDLDLSSWPELARDIQSRSPQVKLQVKTKVDASTGDEYQNIYIQKGL